MCHSNRRKTANEFEKRKGERKREMNEAEKIVLEIDDSQRREESDENESD